MQDVPGSSSIDPNTDLRIDTAVLGKKHRVLESNSVPSFDEPIYDIVPLSDDSSTDELVDTNEKFLQRSEPAIATAPVTVVSAQRPSLGSLLTEDRCFKPVHLPSAEEVSLDSINSFEDTNNSNNTNASGNPAQTDTISLNGGQPIERPSTIRLDQTSLSPRLMPKQVTTASVVLITPSSPTKTMESPTINIRPIPATIRLDTNVRSVIPSPIVSSV
ncbi:unnamed protein product [Echinostoma caproni]|uniref:Flocculation protein FLO11-like n=1 Tax=Echinostoma caproni TaxID=27848 RepID=A0A183B7Z1_9TREM|nr:unnamed protein product [Echinostoma caproni]